MGAFLPLLSQYLKHIGFSGVQIGTSMSLGTLIAIISQPLWGLLNDKTQKTKEILSLMLLTISVMLLFFPAIRSFYVFAAAFGLFQFFLCGIGPINDSIVLKSNFEYGSIRQWGAIGFAVAVFVSGILVDHIGIYVIFIVAMLAFVASMLFLRSIHVEKSSTSKIKLSEVRDLLKNKNYTIFLLGAFFIGGTMNANNTYFALLYRSLGGTMTGVGFAFLLFASSEAPFMKHSSKIINKIGIEKMISFSALIFCLRWLWYSTSPAPKLMIIFFFLQGMSIGIFIAGAAQYIKQHTSISQRTTALAFYGSFSMGIGSMFCVFISGLIIDYFGIDKVYSFYFIWSTIGLSILAYIFKSPKKIVS
jgi:PPP family 3-phenylpropionic acid transporter